LITVDHIRHARADQKAESILMRFAGKKGFVLKSNPPAGWILPQRGIILITPGETGGTAK
jgi:hypothetical protein